MNARQKRFVTEYAIDQNGKRAAIRAGYSERTAESQASRLLTNVKVATALDKLLKEIRMKNIAEVIEIEEFLTLSMRGELDEEVIVSENVGDFMSESRIMTKQISLKDRIKSAELLGRRHSMFTDNKNLNVKTPNIIFDVGDTDE